MIDTESKKDTINHQQDYSLHLNDTTMEAILKRDQRTTYHRVNNHERGCVDQANNLSSIGDIRFEDITNKSVKIARNLNEDTTMKSGNGYRKFHSYQIRNYSSKRIRGYLGYRGSSSTVTWLRLGSLLVTLIFASVNGAPTMTPEDKRLNSPRKWVNPCGFSAMDVESELDVVQLNDEQLLRQIIVQARTALLHAELFRDEYIKETFNTDLADLHSLWKDNHYNWLPSTEEIPKGLNEQLPEEFLKKVEMDEALLDAYEYMQKYAVGLEQVVWDQKDHKNKFHHQFGETQHKLRTMLCELQVAIVERGVTPRADVERSIMLPEFRDMSNSETFRNLRDWLIFRDYMNGLEYVIQVFDHLRKRLAS